MGLSVVDTKVVIEGDEILEVVINGGDVSLLCQCVWMLLLWSEELWTGISWSVVVLM